MSLLPIPIYIGISDKFEIARGLTENSILANTSTAVDIKYIKPDPPMGCTGFTNARYTIKHGIYLDVDMIVLGDIAELWNYKKKGRFVCMVDGSSEVAVIDCDHLCIDKYHEHLLPKSCDIPMIWNIEDKVTIDIKLLHFTKIDTQPWFNQHPDQLAIELYEIYK